MLVDVFTLSMLYILRILFGAASIGVKCSPWLLAFSLFIFLSLAFSKRCSELFALRDKKAAPAGRAYFTWDLVSMSIFGIASSYTGIVVLAQYIHSDEVRLLYAHPVWLWGIVPLTLYWLSRVWLLAARGALNEDPIVFATTDRVTYGIAALSVALLVIAAKSNIAIPGIGE
jgi:4-hydroxybenzoate polyprenyltransferase